MLTDLSLELQPSDVRISDQKESQNALENVRRQYGKDKEMKIVHGDPQETEDLH